MGNRHVSSLRVLLLANARSPHTQRWASGLARRGCAVHVLSIRHHEIQGVKVHSRSLGPKNSTSRIWTLLSYLRLFVASPLLQRRLTPDLVNAHFSITHGTIAVAWKMEPLVISTWGRDVIGADGDLRGWRSILNALVLRKADHVTVTSEFMREPVRRLAGARTAISKVPFGVDTCLFRPESSTAGRRSQKLQGFTIGFVKHLKPKYGPEYLVRSLPVVLAAVPDARIVMAGEGELKEKLRDLARTLDVESRIEFRGRVEHSEVPQLLRTFDVLVNPSVEESETFGVVILEALATGVPVVATAVGGVPEVLGDDGNVALLVPPRDADALGNAIIRMALEPEAYADMQRRGIKKVRDEYEWDVCLDEMLDVFAATVNH